MNEKKAYRAIVFDLYGTLIDIHTDERLPRLWKTMEIWYTAHGASYRRRELREAYLAAVKKEAERRVREWAARDVSVRYPEPEIGHVFEALYAQKTGSMPSGADAGSFAAETASVFRDAAMMHLRLYAGAKELLQDLKAAGLGVFLLSNAQRLYTIPEMRNLGILDHFDDIYISSDYGVKKPDIVFFGQFLKNTGLKPEECLMVGNDLRCDAGGAKAAGMDTYFILSGLSPKADREKKAEQDPQWTGADYVQVGMDLRKTCRNILEMTGGTGAE